MFITVSVTQVANFMKLLNKNKKFHSL